MQKVTPFLWFDGNAQEAVSFYNSIFNSGAGDGEIRHYGPGSRAPEGSVMSGSFKIGGVEFIAFNGGPMYKFTPAISMFVSCETQKEVDYYWDRLLEGGTPNRCGWLTDKFGLTWQVVPTILGELLQSSDREKAGRAMQAMMGMVKLDVAALVAAAEER